MHFAATIAIMISAKYMGGGNQEDGAISGFQVYCAKRRAQRDPSLRKDNESPDYAREGAIREYIRPEVEHSLAFAPRKYLTLTHR